MAEQPPSIAVNGQVHRVEDDGDLPLEERSGMGPSGSDSSHYRR